LEANNQRPPLTLRVNAAKTTRARYLERLRQAGIAAHAVEAVDSGVVLAEPIPVADIPGFADGEVFVQDAAAQLAAVLLDAQPGERILDACAAPGGKATHILERCQNIGALIALERDARRLPRLRQNLRRSIAKAWVIVSDAAANCLTPEYFDRILLDVPCSATGVIRRHPDIKVRRGPGEIEQLVQTQAAILSGVWPCLKPGGKLLYVTCSVLKAENVDQIARFLKRHGDARESELVIPSARRQTFGYQILPGDSEMDGFYYACMEKH
jgi:16S rRNA (cytosine967-C5)-methyltransferase